MNARTTEDRRSLAASAADLNLEAIQAQVDRILASDTFRAAETLRRLFRFLANKTFAGEADQLKEYSVAIDALGKPPSFEPSKDAIVRQQASRLRQKLDEYYQHEGRLDPFIVELPKGRFKIVWRPGNVDSSAEAPVQTTTPAAPQTAEATSAKEPQAISRWRRLAAGLAMLCLVLALASMWSLSRATRTPAAVHVGPSSPALDEIWSPFLSSSHHLMLAFSNPFFVRLQESGYRDIIYHTMGVNSWDDAKSSPELPVLSRALGNPKATATFNMVERSTLLSTFVMSRFLAGRADISLARSSDVSWQQLSDNDVILLTGLTLDQGNSLPTQLAFTIDKAGVRNLHPRSGEPDVYPDPQDHQESDGEGLELISMLPGPLGRTHVMTFSSNHAWGIICGVQALTDPAFTRILAGNLRSSSGKIPPYYQAVLRISYRDGTPIAASYITHRTLTLK
jgi:hypothetical protein